MIRRVIPAIKATAAMTVAYTVRIETPPAPAVGTAGAS